MNAFKARKYSPVGSLLAGFVTIAVVIWLLITLGSIAQAQQKPPRKSAPAQDLKLSEGFRVPQFKALNAQYRIQHGIGTTVDKDTVHSASDEATIKEKTAGDKKIGAMWAEFFFFSSV